MAIVTLLRPNLLWSHKYNLNIVQSASSVQSELKKAQTRFLIWRYRTKCKFPRNALFFKLGTLGLQKQTLVQTDVSAGLEWVWWKTTYYHYTNHHYNLYLLNLLAQCPWLLHWQPLHLLPLIYDHNIYHYFTYCRLIYRPTATTPISTTPTTTSSTSIFLLYITPNITTATTTTTTTVAGVCTAPVARSTDPMAVGSSRKRELVWLHQRCVQICKAPIAVCWNGLHHCQAQIS